MADDRQPDPRLVWRWAGDAVRPVLGWVLTIIGALALILGYLGVSNEVLVARQLPYVVSGGLGGIALVFLGGIYLGAQDVRRSTERILRLERLVAELHGVLLAHTDATVEASEAIVRTVRTDEEPTTQLPPLNGEPDAVYALPSGSTYHRANCVVIQGKGAARVDTADAEKRGLSACKLCEPVASLNV